MYTAVLILTQQLLAQSVILVPSIQQEAHFTAHSADGNFEFYTLIT
jgi:hypothetical protein